MKSYITFLAVSSLLYTVEGLKCFKQSGTSANSSMTCSTGNACYVGFEQKEDGTYMTTTRGCDSRNFEEGTCELNGPSYGLLNGKCYCTGDNCNLNPSILAKDSSRKTCHICTSSQQECAFEETNSTILSKFTTCPIGVKYCIVSKSWNSGSAKMQYTRNCEPELRDDEPEFEENSVEGCTANSCTCSSNKCNTGFTGVMCKKYSLNTCSDNPFDVSSSTLNCLSGTTTCKVRKISLDGTCMQYQYGCGVGHADVSECVENVDLAGVHFGATDCYCQGDLCDPTNGSESLVYSAWLLVFVAICASL